MKTLGQSIPERGASAKATREPEVVKETKEASVAE